MSKHHDSLLFMVLYRWHWTDSVFVWTCILFAHTIIAWSDSKLKIWIYVSYSATVLWREIDCSYTCWKLFFTNEHDTIIKILPNAAHNIFVSLFSLLSSNSEGGRHRLPKYTLVPKILSRRCNRVLPLRSVIFVLSRNKKVVLSQGEPRDVAVNFDRPIGVKFYIKSIIERLCTLNTVTLSTRAHLAPKPAQTTWITFRGHSRSRILGSLKSDPKADDGLRITV